jgi:hypothetical protein
MTTQMGLKQIRDAVTALRPTPLEIEDRDGSQFVGTPVQFDPIYESAVFEDADGQFQFRQLQTLRSASPVQDYCI